MLKVTRRGVTCDHRECKANAPTDHTLTCCVLLLLCILFALSSPVKTIAQDIQPRDPAACDNPANPVVAENCLPGSDDWMVETVTGDIEGFAYPPSVNLGETLDFYVNTSAPAYQIDIYRSGYYGGLGGRLIDSLGDLPGQPQPECHHELDSGLTSCANWSVSHSITIPDEWVSGVYIAKLTRADTGGQNYMLFVVRDDERDSDMLYQQSTFTFQAYNNYGGKSLYDGVSGHCPTVSGAPRAVAVSMFRPYVGDMGLVGNYANNYFRPEYPVVRWLEAQGYDVTYSTNLDTHRSGKPGADNELLDHKIFLSVGHDEYWSQEIRDAVTAARDAGVHIAFFTGNTAYWHVRLDNDPVTGAPDSAMITYKTTQGGPVDPTGHHTGTWRDANGANQPENELLGVQYIGDNVRLFFPLRITAAEAQNPLFRHTDLQTMPENTYANIGQEVVGWEWDAAFDNGFSPPDLDILAESPGFGFMLQDDGNARNGQARITDAHITRYQAESGAIVFNAGTIQWGWGLGARGLEPIPVDPYLSQITYNLFDSMGVQPATPDTNLILDGEDGLINAEAVVFRPLDTPPATISNIRVENASDITDSGREVTVTFDTDIPALGQVYYGTDRDHMIDYSDPETAYATRHSVNVRGLKPGVEYFYTVGILDERGQVALSDAASFTTSTNLLASAAFAGRDVLRDTQCFVQANPTGAAAVAGIAVAVIAFGGWRFVSRLRKRQL